MLVRKTRLQHSQTFQCKGILARFKSIKETSGRLQKEMDQQGDEGGDEWLQVRQFPWAPAATKFSFC